MSMGFKITPKNKRLLKSSRVRKWVRATEELINKKIQEQDVQSKIAESIALGVPIELFSDGSIRLVKDFYKEDKLC
jgi:hypothetical protein